MGKYMNKKYVGISNLALYDDESNANNANTCLN
jgi:hypothetical protein